MYKSINSTKGIQLFKYTHHVYSVYFETFVLHRYVNIFSATKYLALPLHGKVLAQGYQEMSPHIISPLWQSLLAYLSNEPCHCTFENISILHVKGQKHSSLLEFVLTQGETYVEENIFARFFPVYRKQTQNVWLLVCPLHPSFP